MKVLNVEDFLKKENKRAFQIGNELIEKPKLSMMVVVFPILLINFIQDSRIYRYKKEFFIKEYMFLKNIVIQFLTEKSDILESEFLLKLENSLSKNLKHKNIYDAQIDEALSIRNYIAGEKSENIMREKEVVTLNRTIESLELKGDSLETSLKLLNILKKLH
ncbi:MAG: hypothetical protein ACRCYM_03290 [Cetobacterium sp.]